LSKAGFSNVRIAHETIASREIVFATGHR
jgi:hypothetical protein